MHWSKGRWKSIEKSKIPDILILKTKKILNVKLLLWLKNNITQIKLKNNSTTKFRVLEVGFSNLSMYLLTGLLSISVPYPIKYASLMNCQNHKYTPSTFLLLTRNRKQENIFVAVDNQQIRSGTQCQCMQANVSIFKIKFQFNHILISEGY